MNKYIYLIIFIVYYSIATFIFVNFLFNPNLNITLMNTKTKKERNASIKELAFYSILWIIFMPLSKYEKGEE